MQDGIKKIRYKKLLFLKMQMIILCAPQLLISEDALRNQTIISFVNESELRNFEDNLKLQQKMAHHTYHIIVEEGLDGYLISSVIELPGCHTQAINYDDLLKRTKEAIELYLDEKKRFKPTSKFLSLQQISV